MPKMFKFNAIAGTFNKIKQATYAGINSLK